MEPSLNPEVQELPLGVPRFRRKVSSFLESNGLRLEEVDLYLAIIGEDGEILAGGGLKGDVIKCVAVGESARSQGLAAPLVSRLISEAFRRGVTSLKVFTKPSNESVFSSLGFRVLAKAPQAILMENGRGLEEYCGRLRDISGGSGLAGVIVMNANPFTLGHLHLVRTAAAQVDRLFIIPVAEEGQRFPYAERFEMIRLGCGELATVVPGSSYQISSATFPTYFLKDLSDASETQMRLDIDLFCRYIAPALGVSVRFAGSEPLDPLTARYNALMSELLPAACLSFVEVPRLCFADYPDSASVPQSAIHSINTSAHECASSLDSNFGNDCAPRSVSGSNNDCAPDSDSGHEGSTRSVTDSDYECPFRPISASAVREALDRGFYPAGLVPSSTRPYLLADLMARALRMELEAPLKPGLVDPSGTGAHSDMDYSLMKGSIDVIRRSFTKHFNPSDPVASGRAAEADLLAFTGGVNTYRGAIFSHFALAYATLLHPSPQSQPVDSQSINATPCGENPAGTLPKSLETNQLTLQPEYIPASQSALPPSQSTLPPSQSALPQEQTPISGRKMLTFDNQSLSQSSCCQNAAGTLGNWLNVNELHFTARSQYGLCGMIAGLARLVEPQVASHGGKAVAEHGVRGALAMARDGYKELFEDWLPYYRNIKGEEYALQRTLLHIMSQLDDTCIIHRAGYDRAQQVKREAARLLEIADQVGNDGIVTDNFDMVTCNYDKQAGNDEKAAIQDAVSLCPNGFGPSEQERGPGLPGTSLFVHKLQLLCAMYKEEGISPGGSADMLSLTLFADSILTNITKSSW